MLKPVDRNRNVLMLENDMIYIIKGNSGEGKLMTAFLLASDAGVLV